MHTRSAYQDQPSARLMSLEEFGSKLQELDDARRLARAELESLTRRHKHIEQLEQGRKAPLKSMAELIPDRMLWKVSCLRSATRSIGCSA